MFQNKVVVITGGANGIGKCIAEEFQKNGAHVCVIDQSEGDHYVERRCYAECATDLPKDRAGRGRRQARRAACGGRPCGTCSGSTQAQILPQLRRAL